MNLQYQLYYGPSRMEHQVIWWETYLDSSTYWQLDHINLWLNEMEIIFQQQQDRKKFTWIFEKEEDAAMFILRWS